MEAYKDLMDAIKLIRGAMYATGKELGSPFNNPAYDMDMHAARYLEEQARVALRGE